MTTIIGPAAGHATLQGTAGDDLITAAGAGNTIYGNGGSDTISAGRHGGAEVFAGSLDDAAFGIASTIRLNGTGNVLHGGDADFTVTSWSGGTTLELGNGDNHISLGGSGNQVVVGLGANDIIAGAGGASVLVSGLDLYGSAGYAVATTVQFSGLGNSFSNQASGGRYPLSAQVTLTGGSGEGHFDLGWGNGTLRTGGLHNEITTGYGTYDIAPGSGFDTVHVGGIYGIGSDVTIHLAGTGNRVDGLASHAAVSGGAGNTALDFQMTDYGGTLYDIHLGGRGNHIVAPGGMAGSVIDAGTGGAEVTFSGIGDITLRGSGNTVHLDAASATLHDLSTGLVVGTTQYADATILGFGAARGAVVEIAADPEGIDSLAEVMAALHDDGAGNAVLTLAGGAVTFAGLHASALHDDNFRLV